MNPTPNPNPMSTPDDAPPLWISEQDVAALLSLPEAIEALAPALAAEARGDAASMPKTMLQYGGHSNLHALGGRLEQLVGTKTWVHAEAGTCPLLMLWDAHDGRLRAVIEAFALGNLRTGATSGLATRQLAAPDARAMAIAGTGRQALSQVAAVVAVRPIDTVRVWGRDAAKAAAFAARVGDALEVEAHACASFADAARGADVVTLATRATDAFAFSAHFKDGAHLNAIGAIGPDREEFAQDVFERARVVAADQVGAVQKLSREFRQRFEGSDWADVVSLGALIAQGSGRDDGAAATAGSAGTAGTAGMRGTHGMAGTHATPRRGLTLFKAMGMGLSDVALGRAVLDRALAQGLGRTLAQPRKAVVQLRDPRDARDPRHQHDPHATRRPVLAR